EEARKIKVAEEQERRNQILEGYITLKEQLPPTLRKTSNTELLKKAASCMKQREKNINNLEIKLDQLNTICIDLELELERVKK
ncbi:40334_t:CDS:2, partial [Gigaspora margarita]